MSRRAAEPGHASGVGPEPDAVRIDLTSDTRAAGQARQGVRQVLTAWRLPSLVDSVLLAVSELVTNAVRDGRPPLFLVLGHDDAGVRVAVHDADPTEPVMDGPHAGPDAESGRGLDIVAAVAEEVGCEQVPGDGKVVYASFDTPATTVPRD